MARFISATYSFIILTIMNMLMSKKLIEASLRLETDIFSNYSSVRAKVTYQIFLRIRGKTAQEIDKQELYKGLQGDIPYALLVYIDDFDISSEEEKITTCLNKIGDFKASVYLFDNYSLVRELQETKWAIMSPEISYIDNDYVSHTIRMEMPEIHDKCTSFRLYIDPNSFDNTEKPYDFEKIFSKERNRLMKREIENPREIKAKLVNLARRNKPLFKNTGGAKAITQLIYEEFIIKTIADDKYELDENMLDENKLIKQKRGNREADNEGKRKYDNLFHVIVRINNKLKKEYGIELFLEKGNLGWMINPAYRGQGNLVLLEAPLNQEYIE